MQATIQGVIDWADEDCSSSSPFFRSLHSLCRIIFITIQKFSKNDLSIRAAALTFTILLSLVPMLAMSTAVVKGLGGGDQLRKVVYSYVASLEEDDPQSNEVSNNVAENGSKEAITSLTKHLNEAVDKIFNYVDKTNFATLGSFGVAGMILSVVLVLGNIEIAMNSIWNVASGRSVLRKTSDYLALLVLMPISLNVGLAASAVLKNDALLIKFSSLLPVIWIQAIILKLLPVIFLAMTLFVIYLFFPNTKVKTVPAMIGAVFAGYFWFEAQNIYINLQVGVSKYNAIYGSFATVPLFLVWMYFGWLFILLGAQLAYACQNKDSYKLRTANVTPSLRLAVAYDVLEYIQQKFEKTEAATIEDFATQYPMHKVSVIKDILDELAAGSLIHKSESDASLKPSLPKEHLSNNRVIHAILGATFSDTHGGNISRKLLETAGQPIADQSTFGSGSNL